MKTTKKAQRLLERIAQVRKMERGKLCKMSGSNYFNHQTWHAGCNVVRYVPHKEIDDLQNAMNGYLLFTKLVRQYADEMIRLTRLHRAKRLKLSQKRRKN